VKKLFLIQSASGYTLMEILVVLFIFSILLLGSETLYTNTVNNNTTMTNSLNAQADVRKAFVTMIAAIRTSSQSSSGAYAIDTASSTYFAFYSDLNGDGLKEKVRYYLSGKILKQGVIKPTGNPSVYNPANETITTLVNDVVNTAGQPIFYYYDDFYNGTSSAMSMPITIANVRLIKIDLLIDHDPIRPPAAQEFTTQVSIRNLKDNL